MNRRVPQTKYFLLWVHPLRRATLAFKRKADAALTFDKLRYRKSWHWWSGLRLRRKKRFGGCSPWGSGRQSYTHLSEVACTTSQQTLNTGTTGNRDRGANKWPVVEIGGCNSSPLNEVPQKGRSHHPFSFNDRSNRSYVPQVAVKTNRKRQALSSFAVEQRISSSQR